MNEKINKKILGKRLGKTLIILIASVSITLGVLYGIPYIRYKINDKHEVRDNFNTMLRNDYCIFRFELNGETIITVDKEINDGCDSRLYFDEDYLYINSKELKMKANYKVTGKYHMKIFNSENTSILMNSVYSISLTKRGINIIGDNIEVLADKMKN